MSPDPYNGSYDLSNPQSLNRYSYVGNNPLRYTDPSGLFLGLPVLAGGGWQAGVVLGGEIAAVGVVGFGIYEGVKELSNIFFAHPTYRGSKLPRPPWDPRSAQLGPPNIAGILGLLGDFVCGLF
jgi:hypothetical protein